MESCPRCKRLCYDRLGSCREEFSLQVPDQHANPNLFSLGEEHHLQNSSRFDLYHDGQHGCQCKLWTVDLQLQSPFMFNYPDRDLDNGFSARREEFAVQEPYRFTFS